MLSQRTNQYVIKSPNQNGFQALWEWIQTIGKGVHYLFTEPVLLTDINYKNKNPYVFSDNSGWFFSFLFLFPLISMFSFFSNFAFENCWCLFYSWRKPFQCSFGVCGVSVECMYIRLCLGSWGVGSVLRPLQCVWEDQNLESYNPHKTRECVCPLFIPALGWKRQGTLGTSWMGELCV